MSLEPKIGSRAKHFSKVKNLRIDRTKRHGELEIFIITIFGEICGASLLKLLFTCSITF